jgi:catechol 2,3-dioxygenase-like lactoylglutathione lyase family enzyme
VDAKLEVIGVVVEDMGRALAFYRDLGLDVPEGKDDEPHVEVAVGQGNLRLAFDTVETIKSFHPEWTAPSGGNRIALSFLCDSPAEVDATHARLTSAGYQSVKDPWDAFWGQRYAIVADPDGNGVDLYAEQA